MTPPRACTNCGAWLTEDEYVLCDTCAASSPGELLARGMGHAAEVLERNAPWTKYIVQADSLKTYNADIGPRMCVCGEPDSPWHRCRIQPGRPEVKHD
jgi:hypothetical protein